jgi:Glycosyl hydrolases family 39
MPMPLVRNVAAAVAMGVALLPACEPVPPSGRGGPPPIRADGCEPLALDGSGTGPLRPTGVPDDVAADDTVRVDLDRPAGPANRDLTGVVWNTGRSIEPLAPVHPTMVRIDGGLQDRSQAPDQLDLQPLLDRVAQVRAIGAEPLVLLSYMPRWLGEPRITRPDQNPTRMGPYDLDAWQELVEEVVRTLATAPDPAYHFEVWNEPDIGIIFWHDTHERFVEMALRTHRAVANVKAETGLPLEVGGPASGFGLGAGMVDYLRRVAEAGLPLDFVSWHNYANTPLLGPDGAEGNLPSELYDLLKGTNPNASPLNYSAEIDDIRATVQAALAGTGVEPELWIDEWNVSAGGYDLRHDSAVGASLVAGTLVEMERAGLDRAAIYRAISGEQNRPGDWGIVTADGTPKPTWWVFRAWWAMTGDRLATDGDDGTTGLWARATRDGGCVSVLLANFVATGSPARTVRVDIDGGQPHCRGRRTTTISTLDADSTSLAAPRSVWFGTHESVAVPMAPQSVAVVQISCGR